MFLNASKRKPYCFINLKYREKGFQNWFCSSTIVIDVESVYSSVSPLFAIFHASSLPHATKWLLQTKALNPHMTMSKHEGRR